MLMMISETLENRQLKIRFIFPDSNFKRFFLQTIQSINRSMLLYSNFKDEPRHLDKTLNRIESKNFLSHNGNSNEIAQHNTSLYLFRVDNKGITHIF